MKDLEQLAKDAYKLKPIDWLPLSVGQAIYYSRNYVLNNKTNNQFFEQNYPKMMNRLAILTFYNGMLVVGLLASLKSFYD